MCDAETKVSTISRITKVEKGFEIEKGFGMMMILLNWDIKDKS